MSLSTTSLAFESDIVRPKAVGLIVLKTDETLENELRSVFDEVPLYHTRILFASQVNAVTLARMEAEIPKACDLFPPTANFAAIGYACTSGATVIGSDRVAAAVHSVYAQAAVTDPLSAAIAAFAELGVCRLALITPYIPALCDIIVAHFTAHGISIIKSASFGCETDADVARISETSMLEAIVQIAQSHTIDAVFISCTNLRSFNILAAAEAQIGKPVLSSNQVLAWQLLRLAGYQSRKNSLGTLLQAH